MSEDALDVDFVTQRSFRSFTPLIIGNGVLNFPPGTIINMLSSTILLNGQFLDQLLRENIIQGATLTNPNDVDTTTTRSLMVASENSNMVGGDLSTILSAVSCLTSDTGTGDFHSSFIAASSTSTMAHTSSDTMYNTSILSSITSDITGSATGRIGNVMIVGSADADITASDGQVSKSAIGYSSTSELTSTSTGEIVESAIFCSAGSDVTSTATTDVTNCAIIGSGTSTIDSTAGAHNRCVIAAANSGSITGGGSNNFACGASPIIIGYDNVFAHNATATASSQAIFGSRLDVTGTGNNITVGTGYVYGRRGMCTQNRTVFTSTSITVEETSLYVNDNTAGRQITIPTAASVGATFPVNSIRSWLIYTLETGPSVTPTRLAASGSDLFNNTTGLTSVSFNRSGTAIHLMLVNIATPFWRIITPIIQTAEYTTITANNFGVTPPQLNASILTTSTGEANHKTLGASTYVTFDTNTFQDVAIFKAGATNIGFRIDVAGWIDITYRFRITHTTAAVGAPFLIRCDILDGSTSATLVNSYTQFAGTNDVSSSTVYSYKVPTTRLAAGTHQLRMSTDSTYPITSAANISTVRISISESF